MKYKQEARGDADAEHKIASKLAIFKTSFSSVAFIYTVGTLALFYYLKNIGWTELLQPSIASLSGLVLIFSGMAIAITCAIILIFGVLFFLCIAVGTYCEKGKLPSYIFIYIFCMFILWGIAYSIILWGSGLDKSHNSIHHIVAVWMANNIVNYMASGFVLVGSIISVTLHRLKARGNSTGRDLVKSIYLGVTVCFSIVLITFINEVSFASMLKMYFDDNAKYILIFLLLPNVLVIYVFIYNYNQTSNVKEARNKSVFVVLFLSVIFFIPLGSFTLPPITLTILRTLSIYSDQSTVFQLTDLNQKYLYEKMGFHLKQDSSLEEATKSRTFIYFEGYVRYRFADILLLCSKYHDPLSKQYNVDLKQGCVQVRPGEVRRFEEVK